MTELEELKVKLADLDELTLIEVLGLTSTNIVELAEEVIEEKFEELLHTLNIKTFLEEDE